MRLPTVTTIVAPPGYDWNEIRGFIMKNYNIEISGGLGPSAGKVGLLVVNLLLVSVMYQLHIYVTCMHDILYNNFLLV